MTTSPFIIVPTAADLTVLTSRAHSARAEHRQVIRSRIILAAAHGHTNAAIAADLGVHVDTVRKWRKRYARHGLDGLNDLPRSGRPPVFTPVQVAQVKALACTPPADSEVPLARWSTADLALEAVTQGVTASISPSTIRRWLAKDAIKPWQHRTWIFPRDADFAAQAGVVLDLYDRRWDGATLAPLLGVTTVQAVSALTTRATVTAHTARRVAVVYDQLCMKVGPSVKARQMATKRGLPSPLAWEDIDDPDESPNFGRYEAGLGEDFDEAVRVLTREGWSAARIAEHLGVSDRTVVRARTRGRVA